MVASMALIRVLPHALTYLQCAFLSVDSFSSVLLVKLGKEDYCRQKDYFQILEKKVWSEVGLRVLAMGVYWGFLGGSFGIPYLAVA